ncbi:MAG: NAD-dependent DNA ligase LigA [Chlamydiales bacterium]
MGRNNYEARSAYLKLIQEINEHNTNYFVRNTPLITDYEYDLLVAKASEIEEAHPEWIPKSGSPISKVSEQRQRGFQSIAHAVPMLSLTNTYSYGEIEEFITRVEKLLDKTNLAYCCELKIDGCALSLCYIDGKFIRAVTRGDGKKGDDVTENVRGISSLPKIIHGKNIPRLLEIRAEVYMTRKEFRKANLDKQERGEAVWANPRNAAAGSLKLLDSKISKSRNLQIFCFAICQGIPSNLNSQYHLHRYLQSLGFPTVAKSNVSLAHNLKEIKEYIEEISEKRDTLPFDIDGIVIKVDNLDDHEYLGTTEKSPRGSIAYKFAPEQAETIIEAITIQIGRTGVLTPVAELRPVFLSGSRVARATLHNGDEIKRKGIGIGDSVLIEKGGEIIPKVVRVTHKKSKAIWHMPRQCPFCNSMVIYKQGEVAARCSNSHCQKKNFLRVLFFIKNMDIDHIGAKVLEKLVNTGAIVQITDLYKLTKEDMKNLPGFKEKSISNILESIEKSKATELDRFIFALGIPFVGQRTAEIIVAKFGSLLNIATADIDEYLSIEGIGEKVANSLYQFFREPHHIEEINEFISLGVHWKSKSRSKYSQHLFTDKKFVLTGSLEHYTRDQATELIKERGGKISNSVSKKTDYILIGTNPGSKLDAAKRLEIYILTEKQFENLL